MNIFKHLYCLLDEQFSRLLGMSIQEAFVILVLTSAAWAALYMVCMIAYAIGS